MAINLVVLFIIGLTYFLYHVFSKKQSYWKDRNVPYIKPLPLLGNYKDMMLLKKHMNEIVGEICNEFPNEPCIGSFFGTEPALIIKDPHLIKLVLSKDFYYCNGREASDYNHREIFAKNMFFATGDEWKVLRMNLTPLFSSLKLKNMFHLIKNCSETFEDLLQKEVPSNPEMDARALLSRYTIDCITACAFGLSSESMKDDINNNPFSIIGKKIFDHSNKKAIQNIIRSMWPALFYGLNFKMVNDEISTFFNNLISGVFKSRENTISTRNDFVDLFLKWKNNKHLSGDSLGNVKNNNKGLANVEVNDALLVSHCIMLFAAGFETTATSLSFLLYELAKDKIIQEKVIKEVDDYFSKYDAIQFDCINSMPYIESCIEESLRLYPVLGVLAREVMHNYSLPTGLNLKKGDRIHIPVYHLQHHPDFFPEPEVFRPDRFYGEQKKNIQPFTYMPFGEGPRTCIGMRFAKMPMYSALLKIFKNYELELAENMPEKLTFNVKSNVLQASSGIHLKFLPRKI